jgi:hypothetical protein
MLAIGRVINNLDVLAFATSAKNSGLQKPFAPAGRRAAKACNPPMILMRNRHYCWKSVLREAMVQREAVNCASGLLEGKLPEFAKSKAVSCYR